MALTRLVARYVRVLVACVALGMVAAPPPVATRVDAVTWIAGGRSAAIAARASHVRPVRAVASARVHGAQTHDAVLGASRPPAAARTIVVHRRIYLRHASLLC